MTYEALVVDVEQLTDKSLLTIWKNLKSYDPKEEHSPGVSMDDWAQLIYSELSKRGIAWQKDHIMSKLEYTITLKLEVEVDDKHKQELEDELTVIWANTARKFNKNLFNEIADIDYDQKTWNQIGVLITIGYK